jgi:hypothetical protein
MGVKEVKGVKGVKDDSLATEQPRSLWDLSEESLSALTS